VDSGEDYWISGPKRDGDDRLYGSRNPVEIDEDVREEIEPGTNRLCLRAEALAMLTDGVDLRGAKLRPWYEREE
jgi:hypothetical protein